MIPAHYVEVGHGPDPDTAATRFVAVGLQNMKVSNFFFTG
jgi:hypothetical protein